MSISLKFTSIPITWCWYFWFKELLYLADAFMQSDILWYVFWEIKLTNLLWLVPCFSSRAAENNVPLDVPFNVMLISEQDILAHVQVVRVDFCYIYDMIVMRYLGSSSSLANSSKLANKITFPKNSLDTHLS